MSSLLFSAVVPQAQMNSNGLLYKAAMVPMEKQKNTTLHERGIDSFVSGGLFYV